MIIIADASEYSRNKPSPYQRIAMSIESAFRQEEAKKFVRWPRMNQLEPPDRDE